MRVDREYLWTAVYICMDDPSAAEGESTHRAIGTGFAVATGTAGSPETPYFVTARHVLMEAGSSRIYVRVRLSDDTFEDIPTRRDDWFESSNADVAVIRLGPGGLSGGTKSRSWIIAPITIDLFVDEDYQYSGPPLSPDKPMPVLHRSSAYGASRLPVGVGDEIFFTSLFVQRPGLSKLLPIARFGHISSMPEEPVTVSILDGSYTFEVLGYLAESLSWGGHSGSPAFWMTSALRNWTNDADKSTVWVPTNIVGFLRLVSAHFQIPQRAKTTKDAENALGEVRTALNSGIAVITPAAAIKELLMSDEVKKDREAAAARAKPTAVGDSAVEGDERDDFLRDLWKVTRPVEPPDQSSS